jgi:hypothetical protein
VRRRVQAARQRARLSPALRVQRIEVPLVVRPSAPAGEQNEPARTPIRSGGGGALGAGFAAGFATGFGAGLVAGSGAGLVAGSGAGLVVGFAAGLAGAGVAFPTGAEDRASPASEDGCAVSGLQPVRTKTAMSTDTTCSRMTHSHTQRGRRSTPLPAPGLPERGLSFEIPGLPGNRPGASSVSSRGRPRRVRAPP